MERRPGERERKRGKEGNRGVMDRFYQESLDSRKLRFVETADGGVAADVRLFAGAMESNIYKRQDRSARRETSKVCKGFRGRKESAEPVLGFAMLAVVCAPMMIWQACVEAEGSSRNLAIFAKA